MYGTAPVNWEIPNLSFEKSYEDRKGNIAKGNLFLKIYKNGYFSWVRTLCPRLTKP